MLHKFIKEFNFFKIDKKILNETIELQHLILQSRTQLERQHLNQAEIHSGVPAPNIIIFFGGSEVRISFLWLLQLQFSVTFFAFDVRQYETIKRFIQLQQPITIGKYYDRVILSGTKNTHSSCLSYFKYVKRTPII